MTISDREVEQHLADYWANCCYDKVEKRAPEDSLTVGALQNVELRVGGSRKLNLLLDKLKDSQ